MLAKPPPNGFSPDAFNIREVGSFCTDRLRSATDDLVFAYITIGKQLAELRGKLKKTTPRGDNEHIGWVQAFQQKQDNGQPVFPFKRRQAEAYINIHKFLVAVALPSRFYKQLPSSLNALLEIAALKFSREQIETAITDKTITTFSDAADIRKLGKQLGLGRKKKTKPETLAPKPKRIAEAFKMLARLDLTLDDLIKEGRSK